MLSSSEKVAGQGVSGAYRELVSSSSPWCQGPIDCYRKSSNRGRCDSLSYNWFSLLFINISKETLRKENWLCAFLTWYTWGKFWKFHFFLKGICETLCIFFLQPDGAFGGGQSYVYRGFGRSWYSTWKKWPTSLTLSTRKNGILFRKKR